jgi:hypothetical protein
MLVRVVGLAAVAAPPALDAGQVRDVGSSLSRERGDALHEAGARDADGHGDSGSWQSMQDTGCASPPSIAG